MKSFRLWEGQAPGALGTADEDIPTLTATSDGRSGEHKPAVVVCPGGGYGMLADHEGKPVAEWLETLGLRGFVLKYRLGPRYHHPVMISDAWRALQFVRARAGELGVAANHIGILGFSAGGHLASTATTLHKAGDPTSTDVIERVDSRPDFSILIYPVVTMADPLTHAGSRENLLGTHPDPKMVEALSNERNVSLSTPPCFLVHAADDDTVPVENSLQFAQALAGHRIPFELHAIESGGHGFGLGAPGSLQDWRPACSAWLKRHLPLNAS